MRGGEHEVGRKRGAGAQVVALIDDHHNGRAAQGAAGGASPVSAQTGYAANINPTMTERTRDMPVKDST